MTDIQIWNKTISRDVKVSSQLVEAAIEGAGYSQWMTSGRNDWRVGLYEVSWEETEGDPSSEQKKLLTYENIVDAILTVAFDHEFRVAKYIRQYVIDAVDQDDAGEIDSEAGDVIIQCALFGEIVFG